MKFLKLDGSTGEVEPHGENFDIFLKMAKEECRYVLPQLPGDTSLKEVVSHVMRIIATNPPYLPKSEIPWILSYMDGLISFANWNIEAKAHISSVKGFLLNGIYGRTSQNSQDRPNFVEITRKFTVVELILAHLYGKRFYSQRGANGKPEHPVTPPIVGILDSLSSSWESHPVFDRRCLDFMDDRGFKTQMTRGFYKGACGVFTIPEGMRFKFQSRGGDEFLGPGTIAPFEVDRFFGTAGGWVDGYQYEGFPELVDKSLVRNFDLMPKIRSTLGRPSMAGQVPMIEIPLSWITHVVEASRFPKLDEIKVHNVCNHIYPSMVDTSLNERIKMVIYDHAANEMKKISEGLRSR